jgi:Flp pilus assembly protein TadG
MRRLLRDTSAGTAAEFALVLPLLLVLLFGIIDSGRLLWEVNRAEKATQAGARFAVVTAPLAPGLATADYVGVDGLTQGDTIPASELGTVVCNQTACCNPSTMCTTPYPTLGTYNSTVFNNIYGRMKVLDPAIQPANVLISYSGSGLGFAGNPNGPQISPIVTVKLTNLQFKPITFLLVKSFTLADFRTTLTAEDLSGTQSN